MAHTLNIRLGVFSGLLAMFAAGETLAARRPRVENRERRWLTHGALLILDALPLRAMALMLPVLAIGAAPDAAELGWGMFNSPDLPLWVEFVLAVLLLDGALWAQHPLMHKVPLFWRFHRVHQVDRDMDGISAVRFHPVEIAASMLLKIGLVYLIGPLALAVVFGVLLNGTALLNHANIALPVWAGSGGRSVLVTPDMRRVHHSRRRTAHDSSSGFARSTWDRPFGTLRAQPDAGHHGMAVGFGWQDQSPARRGWSLALPVRRP